MFCTTCGTKLVKKQDGLDGLVDYCPICQKFCYPSFNVAMSAILIYDNKILLVKQYGRNRNILVAGYVSKGENLEQTIKREILEEIGMEVVDIIYNASSYYEKTNTLMVNYITHVKGEVKPNLEIDSYAWYTIPEALKMIAPNSLAETFLKEAYICNRLK